MAAKEKTVIGGIVNKDIKMTGKTVLITGANTGMGLATAIDMARRGARVLMTSRNVEKGNEAKEQVIKESESDKVVLKQLDLSSMDSVRALAEDINSTEERLDVLINNAGVMMCPQSKTKEGFEMQFGVNHLGHFLLTNLLLDLLKKSAPSRVVTMSSSMHRKFLGAQIHWDDINLEKGYTPSKAYAQSKLMNVLFSRQLAKRLEGTGVTTYVVDPGGVKTDLQRHVGTHENPSFMDRLFSATTWLTRRFWRTPEVGAQTEIYCAVAPELEKETGRFYVDVKRGNESDDGKNDEYAARLWDLSEKYTGLKKDCENTEQATEAVQKDVKLDEKQQTTEETKE